MKYLAFVAYYIYAALVLAATGYVVFYLNRSGWWFLLALVLLQNSPSFSEKKEQIKD